MNQNSANQVRGDNYFTLLDLTPAFRIDEQTLETAYFREQRKYHPDRFVGKLPAERNAALSRSIDINHAYDALKNSLKRAQYLLGLQGVVVGTDHDSIKPSQTLLVEIMELRENAPEKNVISGLIEASTRRIAALYDRQDWQSMAQETLRLGYLTKIKDDTQ